MPPSDLLAGAVPGGLIGAGAARMPRLRVLANGQMLAGAVAAEVWCTSYYTADRFQVRVALDGDPYASLWTRMQRGEILIDVQIGLGAGAVSSGWTSLVQGLADTVELDVIAREAVICGRDLTAGLIEARTQETFANRTASEIATLLAGRHGLSADAQATSAPVGRYWELEHDSITLNTFSRATTEWDLLVALAQHEGFDVWVTGTTLHFRPVPTDVPPGFVLQPVATVDGAATVTQLRLERALTFTGDIEVTVKTWNSRQAAAFVQTATAGGGAGTPRRYVYVAPNLTPDSAQQLAQRHVAALNRQAKRLCAEMPGELSLAPRALVLLQATGTDFDGLYQVDEVERRLDAVHGFDQRIRATSVAATGS